MEVLIMHTQKVAITIPADLVIMIDDISRQMGLSRSKYISTVLREKVLFEKVPFAGLIFQRERVLSRLDVGRVL